MAREIYVLLGTGLLFLVGCDISIDIPDYPEASTDYSESASFAGIEELHIDWLAGDIVLLVNPEATNITVTGTKQATAETEDEAELFLAGIDVDLTDVGDGLMTIEMQVPQVSGFADFSASAEVTIPVGVILTIHNPEGDVRLTGNNHLTTVTVSDGNVTIREQQSGHVQVTGDEGDIDIESRNGNITVELVQGTVTLKCEPSLNAQLRVDLLTGIVNLAVDEDFGAQMVVEVDSGDLDLDLEGFPVSDLVVDDDQVSATLGDGTGLIDIRVDGGTIIFGPLTENLF
ncbi:MAG: hypothetical protein HJJLKODD_02223 [Phycisphaerae bacterium]|nr:hypothetical protein [Phycisphaerae bacterium]